MRNVVLVFISCLAACGAKPKAAARVVAPPPIPAPRLKAEGPDVAYAMPAGWRAMPSKDAAGPVVLVHPGNKDEAIALVLQETAFDDKVEEVTLRWAMMAASMLNSFHVTDMEEPKYVSDEESIFTVSGLDDAKRPMMLVCRIRHVGSNVADFWVIVMLTGAAKDAKELTDVGDKLVQSLQVRPQTAPK